MRGMILAATALLLYFTQTAIARGEASLSPVSADTWHERALEATQAGDLAARGAALDAAVAADPDHAPSRGERGEVWAEGRWVSAEYALELASGNKNIAEYARRRAAMDDTPASHARMARWCERAGLTEEARPHWLAVLKADPDNAAALAGIDAVWRDGRLVESEVAHQADDDSTLAARKAKEWENRLARFDRARRAIDEEALAALREELDQYAAAAVEVRVARLSNGSTADRQIVEAYLAASSGVSASEMTASLCRIATLAPDEAVRTAAAEELARRDKFDVMPQLLATLRSPIETEAKVSLLQEGGIGFTRSFNEEGAEVDRHHEVSRNYLFSQAGLSRLPSIDEQIDVLFEARIQAASAALKFKDENEATESRVSHYNRNIAEANGRTIEVLANVTKLDLGDRPREWWDHWQRYSGYDVPYERPVSRTYNTSSQYVTPPPPPPMPRCECFVAGTPVWTRDGKQAIETLRAGDLVLARDPHRGGLVYRVVTGTTVREPSPMVAVVAGDETIHATEGHPFWVVGHGWRMAKELVEGDVLSTIDGPATVTKVEGHTSERAYNLVVEGAANYYVGQRGVLVHDNTPRAPAVGLVAQR